MGKIVARNAVVLAGARNITGRVSQATLNLSAEAPDVTTFGQDNRERLSDGIKDNEFTAGGFWDESASQIGELFNQIASGSTYYGFYYVSAVASSQGREFGGVLSDYTIDESVEGAAATSITVSGSSPSYVSKSLILVEAACAQGATLADSVDFSGSSQDSVFVFRVFGLDNGTGVEEIAACIQSADDDSSFATKYVFTAASAGSTIEYSTGSLDRYRRVRYNISGSDSNEVSASFLITCGNLPVVG